ncbi:MAG TPA: carboxypeptidase-like regulatory domain-containing protein [Bryobacterales bacterium]|nr:carboxypeptidase-like regulatory domain-containing protein [Bryobacterales bacterium]
MRRIVLAPATRAAWKILVVILVASHLALAQSTATLTGTVVDPSGAVVPDTDVTCRNTGTGLTYHMAANSGGLFRFADLPIGSYELTATHPGFERLVRSGLELLTGRTVDVMLQLQVGQTTELLEVTAAAPVVQTTSSEVQSSFDSRNTRELPLNGRNPLQLVVLTPGARLSSVGTQGDQEENTGVTTNGLRAIDNNYELDGAMYLNRQFNSAPVLPSPDSLQEFTVKASNYSASESGAGATVQLSTRSGTNEFHGSAFEFLRNNDLDARNFFSRAVTPFKRNQYGGTFGGPIVKDKTFIFGAYQGTRVSGGANPTQATVPTSAMRGGDFSSLTKSIVDPTTGQPFPGNMIPSSRFDPLAVKLLPFVPLPNLPNLLVTQTPNSHIDDDQFLVRIDHNLSAQDHFTARHSFDEYDYNRLTSAFSTIYARNFFRDQNLVVSDTHTFSPALLFFGSFGYTRVSRTQIPTEPTTLQDLGQKVPEAIASAHPELRVNVNGYFNLFSGGGLAAQSRIFQYRGRLTWARGRHFVQIGMDIERDLMYSTDTSFASGTDTFNGQRTSLASIRNSGDAFADFLIGLPSDFNQGGRTPQDFYEMRWQPWIQDDWKVLPRLTLNLGLRWEPWLPPLDQLGPFTGFIPGVQSKAAPDAPRGLLFSGDPGLRDSIFPIDWNNLAPRVGLAWDVTGSGRNVVRAAYGIFIRSVPLNLVRSANSGSAFRSLSTDIPNPPSFQDPYRDFPGGAPFPFNPPPTSALGTYHFIRPVITSVLDPASRSGYTQQWNLTLERQIRNDLGISASYLGSHSIGIMAAYQANPGVYGPGATTSNTDSRRLYPGLGALAVSSPWGFSNYHSFQLQATKRAGRGLSILGNYVFSKCMDDTTGQVLGADAGGGNQIHKFNLHSDYAPCDFNVAHVANASLIYDLPQLSSLHGPAGSLMNGWTLTSIVSARTGLPFSVFSGRDNSLTGAPNNDLADQLTPSSARPSSANPLQEWFNAPDFVVNALGTFGNSGRNALYGPRFWNVDFGVVKQTRLTEKMRLEFRFEAFNIFNHPNFGIPGVPINTVTNPNFGKVLSASDPRVLQFALKLAF